MRINGSDIPKENELIRLLDNNKLDYYKGTGIDSAQIMLDMDIDEFIDFANKHDLDVFYKYSYYDLPEEVYVYKDRFLDKEWQDFNKYYVGQIDYLTLTVVYNSMVFVQQYDNKTLDEIKCELKRRLVNLQFQ